MNLQKVKSAYKIVYYNHEAIYAMQEQSCMVFSCAERREPMGKIIIAILSVAIIVAKEIFDEE